MEGRKTIAYLKISPLITCFQELSLLISPLDRSPPSFISCTDVFLSQLESTCM